MSVNERAFEMSKRFLSSVGICICRYTYRRVYACVCVGNMCVCMHLICQYAIKCLLEACEH